LEEKHIICIYGNIMKAITLYNWYIISKNFYASKNTIKKVKKKKNAKCGGIIPAFRGLRHEDHKFSVSLG
jgi:hypothetical protein